MHANGEANDLGHPDLVAKLTTEIERSGPMPFARFMECALYDPDYGYYMRLSDAGPHDRIGWAGDFYTAPDAHPLLGRALARQLVQIDEFLGRVSPLRVVEIGGGKGDLARDFLASCESWSPSVFERLEYVFVDRSPLMRKAQEETLAPWPGRVRWLESIDECGNGSVQGMVFSNELVDAFPVHRVRKIDGELLEVFVSFDGARFQECLQPLSSPDLSDYLQRRGVDLPEGHTAEINRAAESWIQHVARILARGVVLTIDYGHTASDLVAPERKGGTLCCYYRHRVSTDPYARIGYQDVTAHVDFTSLATAGEEVGLELTGFTNLMSFLVGLEVESMLEGLDPESPELKAAVQLLRPHGMGDTFKVLVQHKGMEKPALHGLQYRPFFESALLAKA